MQYTKEPWEIRGQDIYDADGIYIATWSGTIKNAHRIIDCVNGCAGIINPSAVRDVVETLNNVQDAIKRHTHIVDPNILWLVTLRAKINQALETLNKGG